MVFNIADKAEDMLSEFLYDINNEDEDDTDLNF